MKLRECFEKRLLRRIAPDMEKEKYSEKLPVHLINALDAYRIERHEALYGVECIVNK